MQLLIQTSEFSSVGRLPGYHIAGIVAEAPSQSERLRNSVE